ncbi:MAG TPA: hypothetical protein VFX97_16965 [Pyrinomonadaceae bacterium]|nr:hypothetical protein [Pyrinomonadaceae bacterium]
MRSEAEQPADKVTPLKLPVRLDLDAYSDAVIHDANWRRIAAFPKTELGTAMAQQVTDALNTSAAVEAALQRIYLAYEADCGCECNNENCCAVVNERCAKCFARAALAQVEAMKGQTS